MARISYKQKLLNIQELVDDGNVISALESLDELIKHKPTLDAHQLRIQILLDTEDDFSNIEQSLIWIESNAPEAFDEIADDMNELLETRLSEYLTVLHADDDIDPYEHLINYAKFEPVAYRFDSFFILRYLLSAHAILIYPKHAPSQQHSFSNIFSIPLPQRMMNDKMLEEQRQELKQLEQDMLMMFDQALMRLEPDNVWYANLYYLNARVFQQLRRPIDAYQAYQKALEAGFDLDNNLLGVELKINEIHSLLTQQASQHITQLIDTHFAQGDIESAAHLIENYGAIIAEKDLVVRRADLAFLRGDLSTAESIYKSVLML